MSNFKEVDGGQGKGCCGAHPSDKQDLPGLAGSSKKWDSFRSNMAGWKAKNSPLFLPCMVIYGWENPSDL